MKEKALFLVFEGLSFGEKNKNLMEIADISFKVSRLKDLFVMGSPVCVCWLEHF